MVNNSFARVNALAIFLILSTGWLTLAKSIPLWNDEIYSQDRSIQNISYQEMFLGGIPEGNRTPLFYLAQKVSQYTIGYKWPGTWSSAALYTIPDRPDTRLVDTEQFANVFLRLLPVACMSASIALIYLYFAAYWSVWLGYYSLLLSLSTFMVWEYAFHARPYALWFFLTSLQLILLLKSLDARSAQGERTLLWITLVHWLLSFTVIFSAVQIMAACMVLWLFGERRVLWHALMSAGPIFITAAYYIVVPHANMYLVDGPIALLGASLPLDRIAIIVVGLIIVGASVLYRAKPLGQIVDKLHLLQGVSFFLLLIYCGAILILMKFRFEDLGFNEGYVRDCNAGCVSNRYFIVLAPVGIVMTSIASHYITTLTKGFYRIVGLLMLLTLMVLRFSRTFDLVILRRLTGH